MKCLLLIDLQSGFCPGGNLAVPGGDEVIPVANRLMAKGGYDLIVASQDWHPADHGSFASHAAIMGREMGFPVVVGTVDATRRIPNGATVRVDGTEGVVVVVG